MIQRRKFNQIKALRMDNGEWTYDQNILQSEVVCFFENFYGESPQPVCQLLSNLFPWFMDQDIEFLGKEVID